MDDSSPRIGIDFDNTIAGYDDVFTALARDEGLLPEGFSGGKKEISSLARAKDDGERLWNRLQGRAYGEYMARAVLLDGVDEFLKVCRKRRASVFIVSHKTEVGHFDPQGVNLREAAKAWMTERGFFDVAGYGIPPENVFFEPSRSQKATRIGTLGCMCFIDDLKEVFLDAGFPGDVRRILLDREGSTGPSEHFDTFGSWGEILTAVFHA